MRHRIKKYKFSRRTTWRNATIKSLVQSLFVHETIKTTRTRAKATQPLVEKLISWGKANTVEKKRLAFAVLGEHKLVQLLFADIAPRFKTRTSGFTRILRLENRRGDDAQMVLFQLTQLTEKAKAEKTKKSVKEDVVAGEVSEKTHDEKPAKAEAPAEEKEKKPGSEKAKRAVKPPKKFMGGIRGIFKKKSDSL
ncbi:MAG: 50S ribosomal protein L17 [Candidatus Omnitrophota bacterium]